VGQGDKEEGLPVMHLIPKGAWWIASWCSEHLSLDICTPPTLVDGEWWYTDLDLLLHPDGRLEILDEDEFAEACEADEIPEEEARVAQAAMQEVEQCLRLRTEPFDRVGWDRLGEAVSLSLPPIKTLRHVET
jgi:hypothetical protein